LHPYRPHIHSQQGLTITSPDGDLFFPSPNVVRSTREYAETRGGKPADWVVLALKTTSFHEVREELDFGFWICACLV
jgi:ketopantoate reductase